MIYFINDLNNLEFNRKKGSKDKLKRKTKTKTLSKKSKSSSNGNDGLTTYDKVNLPLKAWSNTHQSSREIRGWIGTLQRLQGLVN